MKRKIFFGVCMFANGAHDRAKEKIHFDLPVQVLVYKKLYTKVLRVKMVSKVSFRGGNPQTFLTHQAIIFFNINYIYC